jgi:hypothetical protein
MIPKKKFYLIYIMAMGLGCKIKAQCEFAVEWSESVSLLIALGMA